MLVLVFLAAGGNLCSRSRLEFLGSGFFAVVRV